jgi:dTDP-4-amino-4,6-dideoxygalactose transaminase
MNSARDPIPQLDLAAQYAAIGEELRAAVEAVFARQQFILGPEVEALERDVARLCGVRYGVGVASGTDALALSLRAAGIGPGDEVIVPAFTFIATASAVSLVGARPRFADIDAATFNLDPAQLEAQITPAARAIVPVHLYGQPAEMSAILEIARFHNLFVIEDAAQAIGATYKGRPVGSFGLAGCLSFYPTKNLGGAGDGGMIVTDSEELAARLRALRDHGQTTRYTSAETGWNSRLGEIQAAVLRVKLRYLAGWTAKRQAHAARYTELLGGIPRVEVPRTAPLATHVFHQYTLRVPARDRVREALAARGIGTGLYYPLPLHLQPAYAALGYRRGNYPVSEQAARDVLSLPMYPELLPQQLERVAAALAEAVASV